MKRMKGLKFMKRAFDLRKAILHGLHYLHGLHVFGLAGARWGLPCAAAAGHLAAHGGVAGRVSALAAQVEDVFRRLTVRPAELAELTVRIDAALTRRVRTFLDVGHDSPLFSLRGAHPAVLDPSTLVPGDFVVIGQQAA
jgi:hypothetical protein